VGRSDILTVCSFSSSAEKRRPSAKRQDRGYRHYWNDVFHMFLF